MKPITYDIFTTTTCALFYGLFKMLLSSEVIIQCPVRQQNI